MALLTLVERSGQAIPEAVREAGKLSGYAVQARYPGPFEPVTRDEYREAVGLPERAVRWVESLTAD